MAKIPFSSFYSIATKNTEINQNTSLSKRYVVLNSAEYEKASYFNANWNPMGVITCSIKIEDKPDLLIEKKEQTIIEKIFALFLTNHKTETFKTIFNLLSEANHGSFLCNIWTVIGCLPADYYYSFFYGKCEIAACDGISCKKEFCMGGYRDMSPVDAENAYFYMQEAAAAYSTGIPVHHLQTVKNREDIVNKKYRAILERLTINDGDLIEYNEGHDSISGYVLYFKRKTIKDKPDTIAISFRGTFSTNDAFNDLQSTYIEFQDGYTHAGFKKLADYFMRTKMAQILKIAEKKKIKKIFLTGHSLGAAVATLVHARMLEKYPNINVKSVIFASPPVFSENIVKRLNLDLTHYTYGYDFVSRLSYGSILDLKYFCLSISSLVKMINSPGLLTTKIEEIRHHMKTRSTNPKLYHPGKQIHVFKFDEIYKFKQVNYMFYNEILFSRNAGWDHFLHNIANAFIYASSKEKD